MKNLIIVVLILYFSSCSSQLIRESVYKPADELIYVVDLNDREDDTFKVKLFVNNLKPENAIYQFAASAPGTYQTMDIGRFVKTFTAFDKNGKEIKSTQISTNQWQISEPEKVTLIQYKIAETWDTPVDSNHIYPMCGTSMENDHVLLNGQGVFGYPTGMQRRAIKIKLLYPEDWITGTALSLDSDGFYLAKNYDHIVDSPILTGNLTEAAVNVRGTKVEIYVYSKLNMVQAKEILSRANNILNAAADFTDGLPVERYTFLFHYENTDFPGAGAWEHNYSSIYAFKESPIEMQRDIQRVMAHEFFHIITPLNIHSELVEQFNFVNPQPSEHLWLYEATTEWAAQIMQLRANLIGLNDYLNEISDKLNNADHFRKDYSLRELSLNSFSNAGKGQYVNVYEKGAVISGLLDIRLLELSNGKRGLREVMNELSKIYGPEKAFDEKTFYQTFTKFTYPEIDDFFNKYVKGTEPLPVADYYSKLGISYSEKLETGEIDTTRGYGIGFIDGVFVAKNVDKQIISLGLTEDNVIVEINREAVSMKNIRRLAHEIDGTSFSDHYTLKILKDGVEKLLTLKKIIRPKMQKHIFTVDEDADEMKITLREAWMQNL